MMKWFGENWGAPVCEHGEQVAVPNGRCWHCDERFKEGDRGVVLPFISGEPEEREAPYHIACIKEQITGEQDN